MYFIYLFIDFCPWHCSALPRIPRFMIMRAEKTRKMEKRHRSFVPRDGSETDNIAISMGTWRVLDGYLTGTWRVLDGYLTGTWRVLDGYLTGTWSLDLAWQIESCLMFLFKVCFFGGLLRIYGDTIVETWTGIPRINRGFNHESYGVYVVLMMSWLSWWT